MTLLFPMLESFKSAPYFWPPNGAMVNFRKRDNSREFRDIFAGSLDGYNRVTTTGRFITNGTEKQ
jgi:hypothetical protein